MLLNSAVHAESSSAAVVWYRAAGECPQGPEFIGQFLGRTRLAEAGDHIDFVVTLLAANGETVGRLERQTESGTVAIRELRDPNCSRVADALALSLALSLEPGRARSAPAASAAPEAPTAPTEPIAPTASATPAAAPAPTLPSPASGVSVDNEPASGPSDRATSRAQELRGGWLGLQGGALLGLAPQALARSAVFVGLEDPWPEFVSGSALRLAAVGVLSVIGTSSTRTFSTRSASTAGVAFSPLCSTRIRRPYACSTARETSTATACGSARRKRSSGATAAASTRVPSIQNSERELARPHSNSTGLSRAGGTESRRS